MSRLQELGRAPIKHGKVLWIVYDPAGLALPPFDLDTARYAKHWICKWRSRWHVGLDFGLWLELSACENFQRKRLSLLVGLVDLRHTLASQPRSQMAIFAKEVASSLLRIVGHIGAISQRVPNWLRQPLIIFYLSSTISCGKL